MDEEVPEKTMSGSLLTLDDFKPIKVVGYGDMGTVFLAVLRGTNEVFAVKVMDKEILHARENIRRAEMERKILSMLSYQFLPSLYAHFESDQNIFLVMSYCSGGDLSVLKQKQLDNKFLESEARFYAAEVLLALEHLHKLGIAYRDLKPENVLIQQDGHVMLTDFDLSVILQSNSFLNAPHSSLSAGVKLRKLRKRLSLYLLFACTTSRQRMFQPSHDKRPFRVFPLEIYRKSRTIKRHTLASRSYSFVGTEEYVAPEILWGTGHGTSVDWWTFGVFLYEMVYGTTPFKGNNRKETFHNILAKEPDVPNQYPSLKDLILRLLVKEPAKRLGSKTGATEIKEHTFFNGIVWDDLHDISRPPYVPIPFSLGDYQEHCTNEVVKSDIELFSKSRVAGSTEDVLSNVPAESGHDNNIDRVTDTATTSDRIRREDPFLSLSDLIKIERLLEADGYTSSDSEKEGIDGPGGQRRNLHDVINQKLYDKSLEDSKALTSTSARWFEKKAASSLTYVQSEETLPHYKHLLKAFETACIQKLCLCLRSCGSCFTNDVKHWPQKESKDDLPRLEFLHCRRNVSRDKQENLSKQNNEKIYKKEEASASLPSTINIEEEEDEFFDIELAMEQLAKKNIKLQIPGLVVTDPLSDVF